MHRLAFWTFSCLLSTSKSNPPLFLTPFGLPRISPLPQGPILRYFSLLLDILLPPLRLKVQSSALSHSFWTFSCLPSTSKSNPPLFLTPFGLPRASPPPQSPFRHAPALHHAKKADCKTIRQSQSTSPILHQPIPPSKAPAIPSAIITAVTTIAIISHILLPNVLAVLPNIPPIADISLPIAESFPENAR